MAAEILFQNYDGLTVGTTPAGYINISPANFVVTTSGNVSSPNAVGESAAADGDLCLFSSTIPAAFSVQYQYIPQIDGSSRTMNVGLYFCGDSSGTNGYVINFDGGSGNIAAYKKTGSSFAALSLTSGSLTGPTITSGHTCSIRVDRTGSTISFTAWDSSGSQPGSVNATWTDATYSGTHAGYRLDGTAGFTGFCAADNLYIGDYLATFPGPTTGTVTGSATSTVGTTETFTLTITGDGGASKTWTGTPTLTLSGSATGTITQFSAFSGASTGTATIFWTGAGTASVNATFSDSLAAGSAQAVTVTSATPTVSPSTATVNQLATQQLTASSFTGGSVTWASSDTTVATVNSTGLVTALAKAGTATITATGVSNPSQTATCVITVPAVAVSISPTSATLAPSGTQTFTATVTGTTNTSVTWSNTGSGSVDSSGHYTAPTSGTDSVKATSVADATKSATATVTISTLVSITAVWNAGPGFTGLTGTIRVEWTDASGNEVQAVTTSGITERTGTGIYRASFASAVAGSTYIANWDAGASSGVYFSQAVATPGSAASASVLASNGLDQIIVESGVNARQALALAASFSAGALSGAGTGPIVIAGANTSTARITATTDSNGNRTAVTLNLP